MKKELPVKNDIKPFWKSKTVWINLLTAMAAIATGIAEMLTAGEVVTLMAITNIVLRFVTKSKIN
jgi:hypothetical protein